MWLGRVLGMAGGVIKWLLHFLLEQLYRLEELRWCEFHIQVFPSGAVVLSAGLSLVSYVWEMVRLSADWRLEWSRLKVGVDFGTRV